MTDLTTASDTIVPDVPTPDLAVVTGDSVVVDGVVAGRYAMHSRVARDGDALLFRGHDPVLRRSVSIALFPGGAGGPTASRRLRTARILAGMSHPALLTVYDAGQQDGQGFVVSQLVDGPSLSDRLQAGPLSVPATLRVGLALADALAGVHRHGLIHRALYPGGVVFDVLERVYLVDFSVARAIGAGESAAITNDLIAGADLGSYLAPEQIRGAAVGPAADVYSLGLILLECLTGRREYPGAPVAAASARLHRLPRVPTGLPVPLVAVLTAMTAEESEDRPSAATVATDLRRLARTHSSASAPELAAPPPDPEAPDPEAPDTEAHDPAAASLPATETDARPAGSTTDADRQRARPVATTPARRWRRGPVVALLVLGVVLGVVAGGVIGVVVAHHGGGLPGMGSAASTGPTVPAPAGPVALYGTVTDVPDPATVVVDVGGTPVTVTVLGIDPSATFACARDDARSFARRTLVGQRVTLVPDPTVPDPAGVRRSYVVLATQTSYTDAAIRAGWVAPGRSPGLYRAAFQTEADEAHTAGVGMWGPTC